MHATNLADLNDVRGVTGAHPTGTRTAAEAQPPGPSARSAVSAPQGVSPPPGLCAQPDPRSSPDLRGLCAPIAADLERVNAVLRAELACDLPAVAHLCEHVERYHGKMLRPSVLLLAGAACGGVTPAHHTLGAVVEIVHVATLVHDDVLDEADIRRGSATVNRRWGNEQAVLLGDFLISHAFHLCSSLDSQRASRLIGRTTNAVCEGEIMQVANRGNLELTEEQYFEFIRRKTASLIRTCCVLGAEFAGARLHAVESLGRYGEEVGVAFQIADDLLDLVGVEHETGKSLGRDFAECKLTLPIIHHLRTAPEGQRRRMLEALTQSAALPASQGKRVSGEPETPGCAQTAVARAAHDGASPEDRSPAAGSPVLAWLVETGSIEYARGAARARIAAAVDALSSLPMSAARASLTAMAEFVLSRRS